MTSPAKTVSNMADRIARALNLLGADSDLLGSDGDTLLELIDDYWSDDTDTQPEGK